MRRIDLTDEELNALGEVQWESVVEAFRREPGKVQLRDIAYAIAYMTQCLNMRRSEVAARFGRPVPWCSIAMLFFKLVPEVQELCDLTRERNERIVRSDIECLAFVPRRDQFRRAMNVIRGRDASGNFRTANRVRSS